MKKAINILSAIIIIAIAGAVTGKAKAQSLTFNQVLLVSTSSTVPTGKVWKIESVVMPTGGTVLYSASSGTSGCSCNGSTTNWTSFTTTNLPTTEYYGLVINGSNYMNLSFPIWLPAGTTVVAKGPTVNCYTSTGCYNGFCPPAAWSLSGTLSVIEFNVLP